MRRFFRPIALAILIVLVGGVSIVRADDAQSYGAIAYDRSNGATGWSYSQDDSHTADSLALSQCTKNGGACKVVVSFTNRCAAVAAGTYDRVTTAQGDDADDAQASAITDCSAQGGRQCAIQAWACSLP